MNQICNRFLNIIYYSTAYWYFKFLFGSLGYKSRIKIRGLRLEYPSNIFIGGKVFVGAGSWLAASPNVIDSPKLLIEDEVSLGRFNQIYSNSSITIEKAVVTADRVFISDGVHDFVNPLVPIMYQKIVSKGNIKIGSGTWIGINSCIIGASVGKNCVIAANSVVTKDIPDFCVAGGVPAIILKRYNLETKTWEKTDSHGNFVD